VRHTLAMATIKAALIGATGRMGTAIARVAASRNVEIVTAVASAASKSAGMDLGEVSGGKPCGVRVTTDLEPSLAGVGVVIDFSRPELSLRALHICRAARVPILIGTTGHGTEFDARVTAAAREIAVLVAPNTSVGVALAQELVRLAARVLPVDFDIEITEAHHKHKLDAPSGTALALAKSAAQGRGVDPQAEVTSGRTGSGVRRAGEIGISSVRAGDIVGTHTVLFGGSGERLTIGHEATDRSIFAAGAVQAAAWLAGQPAGRYAMADVLGFKTMT
jgi:4-hydroxy-tetrahydrodipicolinate reductase